ncbi:MAG: terminase family protein, partial [Actinobacteria bacterium]|nr:terminase family protein [Actinomycetota bacterium]
MLKHAKYNWELHAMPKQKLPPGEWTTWLVIAGRGFGKLFSLDTQILTPDRGFVVLADIKVGDSVFDEKGVPTKVLATFDDTPEVAYRLTFSDGTHIDACSGHQWVTWTHVDRKAYNRSAYESGPLPEDWPTWRAKRLTGFAPSWLGREPVEEALTLIRGGLSVRKAAKQVGVSRASLTKFIEAGHWFEPPGVVEESDLGPQVRTTQDIVDTFTYNKRGDLNHSIPVTGVVRLPERPLPMDPYVFGYWIGDGSRSSATITVHADDIPSLGEQLDRAGIEWSRLPSSEKTIGMRGALPALRATGGFGTKEISEGYLLNSPDNRLALLRGLMDSDGYCEPSGSSVEFCSMTRTHAEAVLWLARSFGEKPVLATGRATLNGVDHGEKYRVTWNPTKVNPFLLPRKRDRVSIGTSQQSRNYHRMITAFECIEPVPMRCLTVDSPNSLFLAGEGLIPTHNTRVGSESVRELVTKQGYRAIGLIAPTAADARDVMIEGKGGSSLLEVSPPSDGLQYFPTKRKLTWANGAIANAYSAEEPERLRGPQADLIWSDEFAAWTHLEDTLNMALFGLRLGTNPKHI